MPAVLHVTCGALPALAIWIVLRRGVGAGLRGPLLWLDALPIALGFALGLLATGRPVLTAIPLVAAGAGLLLADRVKRDVLGEPVVFADRSELGDLILHPYLYLPFADRRHLQIGGFAIALALGVVAASEPPLWPVWPWRPPLAFGLAVACFIVPTWRPLLRRLAAFYARRPITRDPARDMALLGMLGCFVVHATLARAERRERQRAARSLQLPALPVGTGPVVIVQSESFMDVRRLQPALGDEALPGWAGLCRDAVSWGRLSVPAWGANTVRTEFAVLTGLEEAALGLDRFNPYDAFAREALPNLAATARAAGYHTVLVHPFDLTFYGRYRVLTAFGFEELIGPEAFRDVAQKNAWVADAEVARVVAEVIRRKGPKVLVFAVTMQNHGPWTAGPPAPGLESVPEAGELGTYLAGVRAADRLIPVLTEALTSGGATGWLLIYGDHQPTLPHALRALGIVDRRTDYALWSTRGGSGVRQDLAAHELGRALLGTMAQTPQLRTDAA